VRQTIIIDSGPVEYTTGTHTRSAHLDPLLIASPVEAAAIAQDNQSLRTFPGSQAESLATTSWSRRSRNDGF
jgi:hypothetical protein